MDAKKRLAEEFFLTMVSLEHRSLLIAWMVSQAAGYVTPHRSKLDLFTFLLFYLINRLSALTYPCSISAGVFLYAPFFLFIKSGTRPSLHWRLITDAPIAGIFLWVWLPLVVSAGTRLDHSMLITTIMNFNGIRLFHNNMILKVL